MQRRFSRFSVALAALAAVASLGLAACGDDTTTSSVSPQSTGTDATTAASADAPQRIVALAPSLTETLFAIGAGDQVVAVDEYSNHPAEAPVTALSGFTPNVEAIVAYEPDLVVLSDDIDGIVARLEAVGVESLLLNAPTTLDDAYAQIEQLGAATGHIGEAAEVVLDMRTRIDAAVDSVPRVTEPVTYYHELDNTLFSVTSSTFVGEVYALFGLENVADAADAQSGGYPQLTTEYVIDTNPDLVFLADSKCCGETAATFGARPGFGVLDAVRNGSIIEVDDDIASRWGPRIADFAEEIAAAFATLPASALAG